jgi:hypothetical protein
MIYDEYEILNIFRMVELVSWSIDRESVCFVVTDKGVSFCLFLYFFSFSQLSLTDQTYYPAKTTIFSCHNKLFNCMLLCSSLSYQATLTLIHFLVLFLLFLFSHLDIIVSSELYHTLLLPTRERECVSHSIYISKVITIKVIIN